MTLFTIKYNRILIITIIVSSCLSFGYGIYSCIVDKSTVDVTETNYGK